MHWNAAVRPVVNIRDMARADGTEAPSFGEPDKTEPLNRVLGTTRLSAQ